MFINLKPDILEQSYRGIKTQTAASRMCTRYDCTYTKQESTWDKTLHGQNKKEQEVSLYLRRTRKNKRRYLPRTRNYNS